ncbi:helix-turn-helix domain-containing protein [Thermotoga petrophila]
MYPTKEQEKKLAKHFDHTLRRIWPGMA